MMSDSKCPSKQRWSSVRALANALFNARFKALSRLFAHSSMRYLLVGLSNTAVGFAVIWIALRGFGLGNVIANVAGYSVALLWSFALNRKWTFYHQGAVRPALVRYLLATLVAYGMNLLVVIWSARWLSENSLFVQVDGMLTYTVVAYVGARYFVFPKRRAPAWRLKRRSAEVRA